MAYTTINKGSSYFNTLLYTGNGSARTITGVGFQPDWVWVKDRTSANSHYLYDVLRGNNLNLFSNDTSAEVNVTTGQNGGGVGSQASDGFTIVAGNVNTNNVNTNNNLYASWNWLANGAGVSNTAGTVTSTVSANTTSGFSIVSYTNPASGSPFTVGHGLGVAPKMIIVKTRNVAQTWGVWQTSIGFGNYLRLDSTAATAAANLVTATSSTTFSTYQNHHATSDTLIAYCFAEVKGYSKIGSYTGNGNADGTFVYTGFKPAFFLGKNSSNGSENWFIFDNKRDPFNTAFRQLFPNTSGAEGTNAAQNIDIVSNGFKMRSVEGRFNESGSTIIYMAFAENPFVTSTQIPTTAR
jgi:hypothetical protein